MRAPHPLRISTLLLTVWLGSGVWVERSQAAGELDPTFDLDGKTTFDLFAGAESGVEVAIQADGKIVVVASHNSDFAVLRFDENGALDPSFGGGDGVVLTDFGALEFASALAIQPDGKILVGGGSGCLSFALARYNPDGTLDTSFDGDGKVLTDFTDCESFSALAVQPDGKIVGFGPTGTLTTDFALIRYLPDGSLDPSFGTGGKASANFGDHDDANAMTLQPDGKIVAVGYFGGKALIARFEPDGDLDPTFDEDGKQSVDFDGYGRANDVAVQPDSKIVVAGQGTLGLRLAVARLNPDGSLDSSFDSDGWLAPVLEGTAEATAVALQADGKILVGGTFQHDFDASFLILRLGADGALDAGFGTGGIVTTDFGRPEDVGVLCPSSRPDCSNDVLRDLALQADGRIVAVGGAGACNPSCQVALARYEGGGAADIEPPTLTVVATPSLLWPPTNQLVPVHVDASATDDVDPSPGIELISATSSEPDDGDPDVQIQSDTDFLLRAERLGSGEGREYRLCYRATDEAGNTVEACCTVRVPRDQSGRAMLVSSGGDLVVHGAQDAPVRSISPGSVHVATSDSKRFETTWVRYEDRDHDGFEDALYAVNGSDAGPEAAGGELSARELQYARWEVGGVGYLAPLGPVSPVGVGLNADPARLSASVSPNPVRDVAVLRYRLPREAKVRLTLYDVGGRMEARLVDGIERAGEHHVHWRAPRTRAANVYWYRLEALGQSLSGRFVVRD